MEGKEGIDDDDDGMGKVKKMNNMRTCILV